MNEPHYLICGATIGSAIGFILVALYYLGKGVLK
jgi:hypothetical protein